LKRHELAALQTKTPIETEAVRYGESEFMRICQQPSIRKLIATTFQMHSYLELPLIAPTGERFHLLFYSRRPDTYQEEHIALFSQLKPILIAAIENQLNADRNVSPAIPLPVTKYVSQPSAKSSSTTAFEGI